jgi:hypothetical protein
MNSISSERFLNQVKSLARSRILTPLRKSNEIGTDPSKAAEGAIEADKVRQEGRTMAGITSGQTEIVATVREKETPIKTDVLAMINIDLAPDGH